MKKIFLCLTLCFLHAAYSTMQADLLDDLLTGAYNAQTMSASAIDSALNKPVDFTIDPALRYSLRHENEQRLFRHSFVADYYLWDNKRNERINLSDQPVRDAVLSPNGRYVVYSKQGNLYIYKIDYKTEVAITHDGYDMDGNYVGSEIFSGISDWLYEEEFGITSLVSFSPDNKYVAFIRLDETEVPTMTWQNYLSASSYPHAESLRYPKAGEANPKATLCVYDIYYKSIKTILLPELKQAYLPRLRWANLPAVQDPKKPVTPTLLVQRLNRDQNEMEVYACNPASLLSTLLYREEFSDYYVDYSQFDSWQWLSDNRFLVLSEQDGCRSVSLHSAQGAKQRRLTPEGLEVTAVYGFDEATQTLYYQAATTPMTRDAYAYNLKKAVNTRLTSEEGCHDLTFSRDYKYYVDCYQSCTTPNRYTLYTAAGKPVRELLNNNDLQARWQQLGLPEMQFASFKTERGDELNYWTLTPKNAKADLPVVMTQYSGPASQRVLNRWRKRWDYYLVSQGYVVACCDPRGTDARGTNFRKQTYMHLGQKEAEDQLSFAAYLGSQPHIDANRIGMIGWSYGGFQVLRTLSEQGKRSGSNAAVMPIKCGAAIAPVTDWRLYDSAYTERYMRRPQVNESGYDAANLSTMASFLSGEVLIMHGMSDDNVHAQHTLRYIDALVEAGKLFQLQIYPDDNHFLRQRSNYRHVHDTLMRFINTHLAH